MISEGHGVSEVRYVDGGARYEILSFPYISTELVEMWLWRAQTFLSFT